MHDLAPHLVPDHVTITPSVLYVGTPVVLVTTTSPDGSTNITPMSSAWALGDRVVLGLVTSGMGAENLLREGECVLNFPSAPLWRRVEAIARATGRDPVPADKAAIGYVHARDKFALGPFTRLASELVRPPRIAECPLQFEARLASSHALAADKPEGAGRLLAIEVKVVRVHAHRDVVVPDTNHVDTERWQPLLYVFRHYVAAGVDMGKTFKAER